MSVNVTFYTNTSDKRALSKTLTGSISKDCQITEDCDILNPTIEVNVFSGLSSKNYMCISDWHRKYFIDSITVTSGGRAIIKGHVDVLSTYKDQILACSAVVCRQQSRGNYYLNDPVYKAKQYKIPTVIEFPNAIFDETGDMVLCVAGAEHLASGN